MGDFTYTVFLVVASIAGALVTLFAAGVVAILVHDAGQARHDAQTPASAPADYRHAA